MINSWSSKKLFFLSWAIRQREFLWVIFLPLSFLWFIVSWWRRKYFRRGKKYKAICPVVSVGNIHGGGSGKTPLVFEICEKFKDRRPVIVSRGYLGSQSAKGGKVKLENPKGADEYGDEPWMFARRLFLPVYFGKNRIRVIKQAEREEKPGLFVLDDGFQYMRLHRDLDIVCIHTRYPVWEGFCHPFGDLREPYSSLKDASAFVLVRGSENKSWDQWFGFLSNYFTKVPVFEAKASEEGFWEDDKRVDLVRGIKVGCFCGIAHPDGFLSALGARSQIVFSEVFPDHYQYQLQDIEKLISKKKSHDAEVLVTTDKDWYKMANLMEKVGERPLSFRVRYELPEDFWRLIDSQLAGR